MGLMQTAAISWSHYIPYTGEDIQKVLHPDSHQIGRLFVVHLIPHTPGARISTIKGFFALHDVAFATQHHVLNIDLES